MRATHRRAVGMIVTLLVLMVYVFFAASVGGLFADKHWTAQIAFFAVAGMGWVIPLYPVFKWMRVPDPEDAAQETAPKASAYRKGR
jgi:Protein of unknown function (DUF2842)